MRIHRSTLALPLVHNSGRPVRRFGLLIALVFFTSSIHASECDTDLETVLYMSSSLIRDVNHDTLRLERIRTVRPLHPTHAVVLQYAFHCGAHVKEPGLSPGVVTQVNIDPFLDLRKSKGVIIVT